MSEQPGTDEAEKIWAWVDDKPCCGFGICRTVRGAGKLIGAEASEEFEEEKHVRIRNQGDLMPPGAEHAVEITEEEAQVLEEANQVCPSKGNYMWPIHVDRGPRPDTTEA